MRRSPRTTAASSELVEGALDSDRAPAAAPDLPIDVAGTAFQEAVWRELRKIPLGETRSYAEIAAAIGQPKAVRAVGTANGDNHVAVLIPCHRVIRSDGTLGGYAGGLDRKRKLLAAEGHAVSVAGAAARRLSACSKDSLRLNTAPKGTFVDGPVEKPLWRRIVDFPLMSMLIALVIAIACFTVGALIAQFLLPPTPALPRQTRFDLVSIPILLLGYELLIRRLGEHPKDDFRDPRALRNLGLGLAAGFMLFSLAVGVVALLGVYRITGPGDASGLVAALVGSAIFPAVSEELVFRGILFRWLEEFGGSWMALLLTSALFGASHLANPNATWIAALGLAFEAGVMLGAAYMLTRSLWMPMGIHAAWNFAQGELYRHPGVGP